MIPLTVGTIGALILFLGAFLLIRDLGRKARAQTRVAVAFIENAWRSTQPQPELPHYQFTVPPTNPYVELYDNWAVRKRQDGRYSVVPIIDGKPRWQAADPAIFEIPAEAWNHAIQLTRAHAAIEAGDTP